MNRAFGWMSDTRPINGCEDYTVYLLPVSCGYRTMEAGDPAGYAMDRPGGRLDYQLLYIQSGSVHFTINGNEMTASAGDMVLIRPHVAHGSRYDPAQRCLVSWLHCTGSAMRTLAEPAFDEDQPILHVGASKHLDGYFQAITVEMQRKDAEYAGMVTALALQLIYYMLRKRTQHTEVALRRRDERIDESVSLMYQHCSQQWTNEQLAAQANLSTSRYIHLFTEIHHTSPLKFLNNIRMNMARELLSTCKLGVSEVAAMCGFQSPQYFCRMFRKATGMTPTQYRDQDAGDDS